jgi:hypothetical protein
VDDEEIRLLRSIDRRLALLTVREEREVQLRLNEEILRTEARKAMFNAIDGRRGSPEIARAVGASERAVQMFVKELADAGLVKPVGRTGRGNVVEKDEIGIAEWQLRRAREEVANQ